MENQNIYLTELYIKATEKNGSNVTNCSTHQQPIGRQKVQGNRILGTDMGRFRGRSRKYYFNKRGLTLKFGLQNKIQYI